mmetsp:Transcript_6050/g.15603  ORF Transcript_6050/g.15603 Transcript_6050/m.15603 type:complete len:244 (-) Transcript_6050:474-1205(-)
MQINKSFGCCLKALQMHLLIRCWRRLLSGGSTLVAPFVHLEEPGPQPRGVLCRLRCVFMQLLQCRSARAAACDGRQKVRGENRRFFCQYSAHAVGGHRQDTLTASGVFSPAGRKPRTPIHHRQQIEDELDALLGGTASHHLFHRDWETEDVEQLCQAQRHDILILLLRILQLQACVRCTAGQAGQRELNQREALRPGVEQRVLRLLHAGVADCPQRCCDRIHGKHQRPGGKSCPRTLGAPNGL